MRNPKSSSYNLYGGRGISVCDEWSSYEVFKAWALANGYQDGLEIDRIDPNGNYCPENCRWTTRFVNANNRRNTVKICFRGETIPLGEFCRITSIKRNMATYRLDKGMSGDQIFEELGS